MYTDCADIVYCVLLGSILGLSLTVSGGWREAAVDADLSAADHVRHIWIRINHPRVKIMSVNVIRNFKPGTESTHASGFVVFCKRVQLLFIQCTAQPRLSQNQVTWLLYKLTHLKPLKMSQDKKKQNTLHLSSCSVRSKEVSSTYHRNTAAEHTHTAANTQENRITSNSITPWK